MMRFGTVLYALHQCIAGCYLAFAAERRSARRYLYALELSAASSASPQIFNELLRHFNVVFVSLLFEEFALRFEAPVELAFRHGGAISHGT